MKKKIEIVKACLANNLSYKDTAEHFLNAQVNHKCVYRLMQLLDLKAVICRKRYTYKPHKPQHIADNILNREFQADYNAMEVLLTDITEFKY